MQKVKKRGARRIHYFYLQDELHLHHGNLSSFPYTLEENVFSTTAVCSALVHPIILY